jgi:hypothetical protein
MVKLLGRPRTKRGTVLAIGGGIVVIVVVAFVVVYFVVFPTSSPKRFSLATSKVAAPVHSGTSLSGRWKIASGSQAGYRVREQLAFLPAESDAVGRTSDMTGEATFAESNGAVTVTAAAFTVAVDTLKSDRSMRDEKIHVIGLESNLYPTATFKLSKPLQLPSSALSGDVVHTAVSGVFDIHGTSRQETVPLEMSLSSSEIEAVGSLTFPWSTFGMTAPSVAGFVTVTEKATMEFDLRLRRA